MENITGTATFYSQCSDQMDNKNEVVAKLNRISKENKKLMSMIKLMSNNYNRLQTQMMKHQEDCKRSSLKSMAKTLQLGINTEWDGDNRGRTEHVMDYGSALSDSSEDKNSKSCTYMDDLQLALPCKKRKLNCAVEQNDNGNGSSSTDGDSPSNKKAHVAVPDHAPKKIITVRTKSEANTVIDGCHWRKYGQKTTRNSPWPRAYYKCAAPCCAVKKQVQRCVEDPTVLTATYEGEHNHLLSQVATAAMNAASNQLPFPVSIASISSLSSCPTITLDLITNPELRPNNRPNNAGCHSVGLQFATDNFLQSSLYCSQSASQQADPNYTKAMAVATATSISKLQGAHAQATSNAIQ